MAIVRRRPGNWPAHSRSLGYWLKENSPDVFLIVHAALLAASSDEERETLLPQNIIT